MARGTESGSSVWWWKTHEWVTWGEGMEREELRAKEAAQAHYYQGQAEKELAERSAGNQENRPPRWRAPPMLRGY